MNDDASIGSDNFRLLRLQNNCYVDKTYFLEEFIKSGPNHVTLITRPRRFGKSLAISMMNEFFDCQKDSRDIFDGLKISENKEICSKWMNKFPVIFLKFKDVSATKTDLIYDLLKSELREIIIYHDYLFNNNKINDVYLKDLDAIKNRSATDGQVVITLHILSRCLYTHYGIPPILLIDEYDYPLLKSYNSENDEDFFEILRLMYSKALKSNDFLNFAVLTGCMRISNESILNGLNNLKHFDIASSQFADAFGFTKTEVVSLLKQFGMTQKYNEIRKWYEGYNFGNVTQIYNPWSILNYIQDYTADKSSKPELYWANTSANQFALEILEKNTEILTLDIDDLLKNKYINKIIQNQLTYFDLKSNKDSTFWSIMYATGYLTTIPGTQQNLDNYGEDSEISIDYDYIDKNNYFDDSEDSEDYDDFDLETITTPLKIPNLEVYTMWKTRVTRYLEDNTATYSFANFNEAFWDRNYKIVEKEITEFMANTLSSFDVGEYIYHTMLATILSGRYKVKSNRESGLGRYDIAVRDNNELKKRAAIIEVKRASDPQQLDKLARIALKQISDKKYDSDLRQEGYKTILHWGMAFHGKNCRAIVRPASNAKANKRLPPHA